MDTENITTELLEISMGDIWDKIENIRWRIQNQLDNIWTDYGLHSDGLFSWMYGMFETVYNGIVQKITDTTKDIETWIDETKTKVKDVYNYITGTIKTLMDEISRDIEYFWDDVKDKFKALREDISDWVADIIEDVKDLSNLLVEKVKEILKTLLEMAVSIIGKIEQRFWDTLQIIKDWSLRIIRNIVDRATEIKELVVEKIKETIEEVKKTGLLIIQKTKDFIEDLKDKLVKAWEAFGTVIVDTMNDFKAYLTDMFTLDSEEIVKIMKTLLQAQISAEKDIISTFKGNE